MRYKITSLKHDLSGDVTLTDRHYITEGGEGKIYGKDTNIYKIYIDPKKMIPKSKMEQLCSLNKDNILKPISKIQKNGIDVGFTMLWIKDTFPLCKLFTNSFWSRFNINSKTILNLIERIIEDTKYIHSKDCLIVDGNEFNYLVSNDFKTPYFIDVDSYQTKSFPATAIMPNIRDYHTKVFSPLSDWYSFAIIATQLLIGIHPFRGKHPNYKRSDMEQRMKDNVSIFNKNVTTPSAMRDLGIIPKEYKNWFIELFEKGERTEPPVIGKILPVSMKVRIIKSTNSFTIQLQKEFSEPILHYEDGNVLTNEKLYIGKQKYDIKPGTDLIKTKKTLTSVKVNIENKHLVLETLKGEKIYNNIFCLDKTIINGMLFVLGNEYLLEIEIDEYNKFTATVKSQWNIIPNTIKLFNGIAYQNVLGVPYFILPYKKSTGRTACMMKVIDELRGYRILEMKHESGVVFVVAHKDGKYDRFVFKFENEEYKVAKDEDVLFHVPNFTVLENGIVVSINPYDQVEIFHKNINKSNVKIIEDKDISFSMKLHKKGVQVYIIEDNKLYKFTMKS